MLIDLSRRPVRLTFEECPTVVVIRSLGLRGSADGLLHHESPEVRRSNGLATVSPSARLVKGDREFIETVLAPPREPQRKKNRAAAWDAHRRFEQRQARRDGNPEPLDGVDLLHVVTAYTDQLTTKLNIWRINLVFDPGKKDTRLLTLLDETHSIALLTVNVPAEHPGNTTLFKVRTPLQRLDRVTGAPAGTLWAVLREDED